MEIESQYKERQRSYCKPMCSMIEVVEEEMIATSTDTPTPPGDLKLPTGQKDETTDPNPAKLYPSFNAWATWD